MKWYVAMKGQSLGPLSDENLERMKQQGLVSAKTLVWHQGLEEWIAAEQAGLFPELGKRQEPDRPVKSSNGAPKPTAARSDNSRDVPSPVQHSNPEGSLPGNGPYKPAGDDSGLLGGHVSEPSPVLWYYAIKGARHGPVSEHKLMDLAERDMIPGDCLVWHRGLSGWLPLDQTGLTIGKASDAPSLELEMLTDPNRGKRFALGEKVRLGRLGDNDIVIAHPSVSGHHALIERRGASFVLMDQKSKNGIFCNGRRLYDPHIIHEGEVFRFGSVEFRFQNKAVEKSCSAQDPEATQFASRTVGPGLADQDLDKPIRTPHIPDLEKMKGSAPGHQKVRRSYPYRGRKWMWFLASVFVVLTGLAAAVFFLLPLPAVFRPLAYPQGETIYFRLWGDGGLPPERANGTLHGQGQKPTRLAWNNYLVCQASLTPDGAEIPGGVGVIFPLGQRLEPGQPLWVVSWNADLGQWVGTGERGVVNTTGWRALAHISFFGKVGLATSPPKIIQEQPDPENLVLPVKGTLPLPPIKPDVKTVVRAGWFSSSNDSSSSMKAGDPPDSRADWLWSDDWADLHFPYEHRSAMQTPGLLLLQLSYAWKEPAGGPSVANLPLILSVDQAHMFGFVGEFEASQPLDVQLYRVLHGGHSLRRCGVLSSWPGDSPVLRFHGGANQPPLSLGAVSDIPVADGRAPFSHWHTKQAPFLVYFPQGLAPGTLHFWLRLDGATLLQSGGYLLDRLDSGVPKSPIIPSKTKVLVRVDFLWIPNAQPETFSSQSVAEISEPVNAGAAEVEIPIYLNGYVLQGVAGFPDSFSSAEDSLASEVDWQLEAARVNARFEKRYKAEDGNLVFRRQTEYEIQFPKWLPDFGIGEIKVAGQMHDMAGQAGFGDLGWSIRVGSMPFERRSDLVPLPCLDLGLSPGRLAGSAQLVNQEEAAFVTRFGGFFRPLWVAQAVPLPDNPGRRSLVFRMQTLPPSFGAQSVVEGTQRYSFPQWGLRLNQTDPGFAIGHYLRLSQVSRPPSSQNE